MADIWHGKPGKASLGGRVIIEGGCWFRVAELGAESVLSCGWVGSTCGVTGRFQGLGWMGCDCDFCLVQAGTCPGKTQGWSGMRG